MVQLWKISSYEQLNSCNTCDVCSNLKLRGSHREQQVFSDVHMAGDAGFQPSTIPVDFETCPYMFHMMPQMDTGHICRIQCKRHPFPFSSRCEFPSLLQSASEVHTVAQKAPQGRKLMITNSTRLDKHNPNMSTSTFIRGWHRNFWKASLCSWLGCSMQESKETILCSILWNKAHASRSLGKLSGLADSSRFRVVHCCKTYFGFWCSWWTTFLFTLCTMYVKSWLFRWLQGHKRVWPRIWASDPLLFQSCRTLVSSARVVAFVLAGQMQCLKPGHFEVFAWDLSCKT